MSPDFNKIKIICVVGLRNEPDRPAYFVSEYMKNHGFKIIPVNPRGEDVLGEKGYKSIMEIPADITIDVADYFIRAERVVPLVKEALDRGIPLIWLQSGIISEEASKIARDKGVDIVMDSCIKIEHMKAAKNIL